MSGVQWSDSVTGGAVALNSPIVGGYLDGEYGPADPYGSGWSAAAWAKYPNAFRVYFTVAGMKGVYGPKAQTFADVETGAMSPAQAAAWAKGEIADGYRPGIYGAWAMWPAIDAALAGVGLKRGRDVDGMVAWIGTQVVPAGFVSRQYAQNVPGPYGHNVDLSITDGVWPSRPAPEGEPLSQIMRISPASDQPVSAVRTAGEALYLYWMDEQAQPHGPLGLGAAGTVVDDDVSLEFNAAHLIRLAHTGPDGNPWYYWQLPDGSFRGPLGLESAALAEARAFTEGLMVALRPAS